MTEISASKITAIHELMAHAHTLKMLPRTGWLLANIPNPESIAEHCFATALLTLQLGEAINQSWKDEGLALPLDLAAALKIALLHDLSECMVTDLPKRSVDFLGKDTKQAAEKKAAEQLFHNAPNGDQQMAHFFDYAQRSSPEARLVKDADRLEMVFQAHVYAGQGHSALADFWTGHDWYYQTSKELFEEIRATQTAA